MKTLSKIEIKEKIVKYLENKGICIELTDYDNLIWHYKKEDSEFTITLNINSRNCNYNDDKYIIKYYSSYLIEGIRKRRTLAYGSFCISVYNNLIWIRGYLDQIAKENKINIEQKNKYCTELESYYKKIHKSVRISINSAFNNTYEISVNAEDGKNELTIYSITYSNGKYYLNSKGEYMKKIIYTPI